MITLMCSNPHLPSKHAASLTLGLVMHCERGQDSRNESLAHSGTPNCPKCGMSLASCAPVCSHVSQLQRLGTSCCLSSKALGPLPSQSTASTCREHCIFCHCPCNILQPSHHTSLDDSCEAVLEEAPSSILVLFIGRTLGCLH